MPQNALRAVVICLFAGCGGVQTPEPTSAPPSRHAELAACLDTVLQAGSDSSFAVFASCAAEFHTEPRCQTAWAEGAGVGMERIAAIADTCAASYCSKLSEPRPALCVTKADQDSPIMVLHFAELEAAILSRDAGLRDHPGLLGRFAATLVALMPIQANDIQVTLPTTNQKDELDDPTLVVSLLGDGTLRLNGKSISEGDLRKRFEAAHAQNTEAQVVIKADTTVKYSRVISVMDTAKSAGISRLAFSTTDSGN